jgi:hypothetical protein
MSLAPVPSIILILTIISIQMEQGLTLSRICFLIYPRLMWEGSSPYDRSTFRYPPLVALLLIPNLWFYEFGKVNLSSQLCCLLMFCSCYSLSRISGWSINVTRSPNASAIIGQSPSTLLPSPPNRNTEDRALMSWAFNPLVISICTRVSGSLVPSAHLDTLVRAVSTRSTTF